MRVSGRSQIDGDGFPRQRETITKFCEANKLTIFSFFQEEGVSGSTEAIDRPAFFRMLGLLSPGDGIVCERMDRLARALMTSEILLKECRDRGIKVFAADRGAMVDVASDGADPTVVLIRQVLAAVAEFDKSSLVRKLRAARDRKRALTGKCEGLPMFGSTEPQRMALSVIDNMRADGASYERVAKFLNLSEFPTPRGRKWSSGTVYNVVKIRNKQKI